MLKGLLYWVQGVWPPLSWTINNTGGESEPNLLGYTRETRSIRILPVREGEP